MIIQGDSSPFPFGYTSIVKMNDDKTRKAGMNFGILVLKKGEVMNGSGEKSGKKERVCVLLSGEACFSWRDQSVNVGRTSIWTQKPWCLHVPSGESMSIRALSDRAEVAVLTAFNDRVFEPHFYGGGEVKSEERGKGILNDTSERIVRTIFDYKSAPHSNLVIGETITFPGRWSSYPPHSHMQPEIYHYRFTPDNGFGLAAVGERPTRSITTIPW